jgi:energy-coupling factor transporter ATP-binding protein EcfA2
VKITKFSAQGYRSLRDVRLDDLGDFVVFYGPNGSGKSNVLRGIQTLLLAASIWTEHERTEHQRFKDALIKAQVLDADMPHLGHGPPTSTVLGMEITNPSDWPDVSMALGRMLPERLSLRLTVNWVERDAFEVELDVAFDGVPYAEAERAARQDVPEAAKRSVSAKATVARVVHALFWKVDAARTLRDEVIREGDTTKAADPAEEALRASKPQTAVFYAKNIPDKALRARFESFRQVVAHTLELPALDVAWHPRTGLLDLRQPLRHAPDDCDVSMRNAGLGIEQVVSIAASLVFARARVVAIEEPEAHLHAPTTGRALRKLLAALVHPSERDRPMVDQLFIATHSNLFDLDPSGYWDVSLVDGATQIVRKPLHALYAHHLYEPGPALSLLRESLKLFGDEPVFRSLKDGRPITAREMIQLLDEDDDLALEFLRGMHAAALANLRVEAEDTDREDAAIDPGEKPQ